MEDNEWIRMSGRLLKMVILIGIALWGKYTMGKRNKRLQHFHDAFESGDYEGGLWHLDKYIETHPKDDVAFCYKGLTYGQLGDSKSAEAAFLQAISIKRKSERAHYNLGIIYYSQGQFDKAMEHFVVAKRKMRNHAKLHYYIGMCFVGKEKNDDALKMLKKALSYEKSNKDYIYYGYFMYYQKNNDYANMDLYRSKIVNKDEYFNAE